MTSKGLLSIIYELTQVIPRRAIKTKEILERVELKKGSADEREINLLLYNLEHKGYVSLTKSSNAGIIGASLTELGKRRVVED